MTKIKFCGLQTEADILEANRLMPEYVGFVFWKKSRRFVAPEAAERLKNLLHPEIQAVGVFVDEDPETVAGLLNSGLIDMAQLHGNEDPAYIQALRKKSRKPLIKAVRIRSYRDLANALENTADYLLLDSGMGCGRTFDWTLAGSAADPGNPVPAFCCPLFLAGGLCTENVQEAIRIFQPYAVDVSSGIETDGKKDPGKMETFARAVREYPFGKPDGNAAEPERKE